MTDSEQEKIENRRKLKMSRWQIAIYPGLFLIPLVQVLIGRIVPSAAHSINYMIRLTPLFAWVTYFAWISSRQSRAFRIAGYGLIVILVYALSVFVEWQVDLTVPKNFFWVIQSTLIKYEIVHLFLLMTTMLIARRLFRFHLIRVDEKKLEPVKLTIPFLMCFQTLLAVGILLIFSLTKDENLRPQVSAASTMMSVFGYSLGSTLVAVAFFLPSKLPRWALISISFLFVFAQQFATHLNWEYAHQGMLVPKGHDVFSWESLTSIFNRVAIDSFVLLGMIALIRFLFCKAGLEIYRVGFAKTKV